MMEQEDIDQSKETPSANESSELKKKEEEYRALNDKYLRALADMENLRKRMSREQAEAIKYSNEKILLELIPVLDNFERALHHSNEKKDFDALVEGLKLTMRECLSMMEKFGVCQIESLGKTFDPTKHHAVSQVISQKHEEGTVVEELRKGYFLNDRTLRPALVSVSKKPAENANEA